MTNDSPRVRDTRREDAFEADVEHHLLTHGGFRKANNANWSQELALDRHTILTFIRETQPDAWQRLSEIHGERVEQNFLARLCKELDNWGMLHVLRHGIVDYGVRFKLAFFQPATSKNPDALALYEKNRLTIARQLHHSARHPKDSVDLVLCVNGLPTATAELKNPFTGQTSSHAKQQYSEDRDPRDLLFQFKKRALVHFAVDPDEVWMTTRLAGPDTKFLPFNRGHERGAGNPPDPRGHRTTYLWHNIWAKDSWMDILARFVHLEVEERTVGERLVKKEKIIFPRFHQLDVVRKLERDVREEGPGKNYLVEHSAGSGKSNSIAWLAHSLASLHDATETKVFESVVVISDRRVLDRQLQDTIYQFEHKRGVVACIHKDSKQLAQALAAGIKIIVTTLQKFPFVIEHIDELPDRKYAVIVDEAHSSQSGVASDALKEVLSGAIPDEDADYEDVIRLKMEARRARQPNLSFFAFTATPKPKTLATFGIPNARGGFEPFHCYSMRQAIEEGFILDVLQHYTTYKVFYKLSKQIEEDPRLDKRVAQRAIARYVQLHPHNVAQKVEVIVEHFRRVVMTKIGGQAKAMVVTGSRAEAVRYKQEIDYYLREKGYTAIRTLVAFSGTIKDDYGVEQTESKMNGGLSQTALPRVFGGDDYRVLIVADKYQTGFDQPLLHTMYVDKKLAGVKAVQTLSRLNRTHPGKEDTFVLDFANEAEEILEAFGPYYEGTVIEDTADPNQLYDLQTRLLGFHVLQREEIENFAQAFFLPHRRRRARDHAAFNKYLDPAVERVKGLDDEERDRFKHLLASFTRLYSFLAQVMPFTDPALERLYAWGRLLSTKLRDPEGRIHFQIQDEVALEYYRLQKMSEGKLALRESGDGALSAPSEIGTSKGDSEEEALSAILEVLNDRFGTDFTDADRLFFDQIADDYANDPRIVKQAQANSLDNFRYPFEEAFMEKVLARNELNRETAERLMSEEQLLEVVQNWLLPRVYRRIRNQAEP